MKQYRVFRQIRIRAILPSLSSSSLGSYTCEPVVFASSPLEQVDTMDISDRACWSHPVEDIFRLVHTQPQELTTEEAQRRHAQVAGNALKPHQTPVGDQAARVTIYEPHHSDPSCRCLRLLPPCRSNRHPDSCDDRGPERSPRFSRRSLIPMLYSVPGTAGNSISPRALRGECLRRNSAETKERPKAPTWRCSSNLSWSMVWVEFGF